MEEGQGRQLSARGWVEECNLVDKKKLHQPKPRGPDKRLPAAKIKQVGLYIPENLDLQIIPDKQRWYAAWLLDLIHRKWNMMEINEYGYVLLKLKYVTRVIPNRMWPDLKNTLLKLKLIECDNKIVINSKCLGYKIPDGLYRTQRVVCTDHTVNYKIALLYDKQPHKLKVHRGLDSWVYELKLDYDRTVSIVNTLEPDNCKLDVVDYRNFLTEQCRKIYDKNMWTETDEYGRFHSPLTNLPRELRCCLTVNDKTLAYIDLSNSQPLIMTLCALLYYCGGRRTQERLLAIEFSKENPYGSTVQFLPVLGRLVERILGRYKTIGRLSRGHRLLIPATDKPNDDNPLRVLGRALPDGEEILGELYKLLTICSKGRFYQWLMTKRERGRSVNDSTRLERFKLGVLATLYGEHTVDMTWRGRMQRRLRKRTCWVFDMLCKMKDVDRDHARAARTMQAFESSLFIHSACGRILKERPEVPLLSLHDCLVTTKEKDNVEYVRGVIMGVFADLGITPYLKVKFY